MAKDNVFMDSVIKWFALLAIIFVSQLLYGLFTASATAFSVAIANTLTLTSVLFSALLVIASRVIKISSAYPLTSIYVGYGLLTILIASVAGTGATEMMVFTNAVTAILLFGYESWRK